MGECLKLCIPSWNSSFSTLSNKLYNWHYTDGILKVWFIFARYPLPFLWPQTVSLVLPQWWHCAHIIPGQPLILRILRVTQSGPTTPRVEEGIKIFTARAQLTACVGSLLPTLRLTGVKYNTQSGDNQVHNMNIRGKTSMLVPPEVS